MADALISAVLKQLASYVQTEVTLAICARQEALNLTRNLELVQTVLADADEKQIKNKAVRLWLDNLKQVVYDADDVLDEWNTRDAISQLQSDVDTDVAAGNLEKVFSCLLSLCLLFKHAISRHEIGRQIKDINMRLDVIAKKRTDYGLQVVHQNPDEPRRRLTSSVVDVSKIRGRDQAKEDIISRLLGETSSQGEALRVIAIVGIGGLGKTTLAKLIFNEERVVEIFKTKMWVCVSDPFNLVRVAKAIIKEATSKDVRDSAEWEEVHKALCQSVKGKQVLLVLDDVWTEDGSDWEPLKLALDGGAPGSRLIVTTRNQSVAKIMGSTDSDIHELEKLSDEDSWSLLRDVALVGCEKELEKFEKMGREIAIKCKGVPLAITTLAGVLCERETKEEWKDVLGSDLWEIPRIEQFFLPSLFLSYYSLPSTSKQCFLYCAIFSKDEYLDKDYLIRLWMAQGFFRFEERRDLERIGEDHFRILAMRSFFHDFAKDSDGNITKCKMHDLVHDFAIYLSQNECFYLEAGGTIPDTEKTRHLCGVDLEVPSILKAKKLRTLLMNVETSISCEFLCKLTCLRTLQLSNSKREVLPDEVEKLVHLRYLDLSSNWMLLELPETICNLYNLQVLALNHCVSLRQLPETIGKLSNLRHLEIEGTDDLLSCFPKSIAALSSLRTLREFIVSDSDRGCTIGDLQLLNNLRGALKLSGLSRVTDENDVIRAELKKKVNLRQLTLCFEEESGDGIGMKNVLENLEPSEYLEILEISGYSDSHFPGWVQSRSLLTNVVVMRLYKCNLCTELPALGKLGFLQTLEISGMRSVRRIGSEFYRFGAQMIAFPKLVSLIIRDMEGLEEWEVPISKDTKILPLLVKISLKKCPMLRALPCLGSLESLESLKMTSFGSVTRIGQEFYGFGAHGSLGQMIAFPKLKTFEIEDFHQLEEWDIPISKDTKIMPLVLKWKLWNFPKLRALPRVWRMESLEELRLVELSSVERVGAEFGNEGSLQQDGVIFPKLKILEIQNMDRLEEWSVPLIAPCLKELVLCEFPKLKTLPTFQECVKTLEYLEIKCMPSWEGQEKLVIISDKEGSSSNSSQGGREGDACGLHELVISRCPKLRVVPGYMFSPSLQILTLHSDVGDLYNSFPTDDTLCSITQVILWSLPHSSLPNGFHQLRALQLLAFYLCSTLDFDLKEGLGHFTMLQHLEIGRCPRLRKRFEGDDWRTVLAHVPEITINDVRLQKNNRPGLIKGTGQGFSWRLSLFLLK